MTGEIDHDRLETALRRAGSSWDAAQAHGLMAGRLSVQGIDAGPGCLTQILEVPDDGDALGKELQDLLAAMFESTHRQLAERQSAFAPLLPDDSVAVAARTEALAHWSEGYLHGLVSTEHEQAIRKRLAEEPIAGIIRDLLAITRAAVDADGDERDEAAYAEVVEYLRVAAQLVYEELAGLRTTNRS